MRGRSNGPDYNGIRCTMARWSFVGMSKCRCGRSPTGLCVGWHALKKEDYEQKKKKYEELPEDKKKTAFHVRAIDGIGE